MPGNTINRGRRRRGLHDGMSMGLHHKSGKSRPSFQHFTGKSGNGGSQRKRKSSRKERALKHGTHMNMYARLKGR